MRAFLVLSALFLATGAADATPRSAIPWLSQSIILTAAPPPPRATSMPHSPTDGPPEGDAITVTPLGDISRDAVGLLPPAETGFPRKLWGTVGPGALRDAILSQGGGGVPESIALFRRLMTAEADPPDGQDPGSSVLVARIDRLLEMGALEEANAMIGVAGPDSPELFRRWFDIGLLLDAAQPPCDALRLNPSLSPTLPARVFCLARGGDWNAAEITLTLGKGVGSIPEAQERLLARFLDPELFEGEPDPPMPDPLTPLDFLLREAVGLPRPPGALPLAFLHADLSDHAPMRTRVEAAERLVLSGALDFPALFEAYRAGKPAASGGIWDRALATQALDAALESGDGTEIGKSLRAADAVFSPRGLRVALAQEYGERLAGISPDLLPDNARRAAAELLLLAGASDAAHALLPSPDPRTAALLAIAGNGPLQRPEGDDRLAAALAGLGPHQPADDREEQLAAQVDRGDVGEALLAALELTRAGVETDPPALRAALFVLNRAGQAKVARQIALQTLLPGPVGG